MHLRLGAEKASSKWEMAMDADEKKKKVPAKACLLKPKDQKRGSLARKKPFRQQLLYSSQTAQK